MTTATGARAQAALVLRSPRSRTPRRHADGQRALRHVIEHHGIGADARVVAHLHGAENLGPRPDVDAIADFGRIEGAIGSPIADGHILMDDAVVADLGTSMNDDAALMFDGDAATDPRRIRELDPVKVADAAVKDAIKNAQWSAHNLRSNAHAPIAKPVHGQRLKSRPGCVAAVGSPILGDLGDEADWG